MSFNNKSIFDGIIFFDLIQDLVFIFNISYEYSSNQFANYQIVEIIV